MKETLDKRNDAQCENEPVCPCEQQDKFRALRRKTVMRDLLGIGSETMGSSLEDLLKKTVLEGDKFISWKKSHEPLKMIRFFHKSAGRLVPAERFSDLTCEDFFGIVVPVEMRDDSQFEIWECREDLEPEFPLYRIPFSRLRGVKEYNVVENLRQDVSLILKAKVRDGMVDFKIAFDLDHSAIDRRAEYGTREAPVNTARNSEGAGLKRKSITRFFGPLLKTILGSGARRTDNWYLGDVRNERLYRLADMFRPPILAV